MGWILRLNAVYLPIMESEDNNSVRLRIGVSDAKD